MALSTAISPMVRSKKDPSCKHHPMLAIRIEACETSLLEHHTVSRTTSLSPSKLRSLKLVRQTRSRRSKLWNVRSWRLAKKTKSYKRSKRIKTS